MISGLVSILLMRALGMTDFTCCDVSKGQRESVHMKPWCKQKSAMLTTEISSDDLIMKLVQNIPMGVVSLTIV